MTEEKDILDKLLEMLSANGTVPEKHRQQLQAEALIEIIRRVRSVEETTIAGIFKRRPIVFLMVLMGGFIMLHEMATYLPIGLFIKAALQALGVPIN